MVNEYKITPSSKKKYFYKILFLSLSICVVALVGMSYYENIEDLELIVEVSLVTLLWYSFIYALPVFILYYNHYKYSKGVVFKYDRGQGMFVYSKLSENITFKKEDITLIELCLAITAYEKRVDWLFFGEYHYTSIYTKQKQKIILSCIVCDEIGTIFPENLIVRKGKYLPLIPKSIPNSETKFDSELEIIKERERGPKHPDERVAILLTKFENKSQSELQDIIDNKDKFQKEAVIAAEILMKM
ncbi:hypothetical protein [Aquimarina aquimarini]|uniref:hypothetical protein n=1 Tax=Aquimarina aquimarini TaxID=1191734 RepID=UPI00131EF147|nr:hypothetical protein [Aquimarina aquimarini]